MSGGIYYLCWARIGPHSAHSATPTRAECEAAGYYVVGADPRYADSVLMRRDGEEDAA